jgi:xanthine phosphoribosyltransferase
VYDFDRIRGLIEQIEFPEKFDMVVAIANGGIIPAAMLNQRLGVEFQLLKLSLRDPEQRPMYDAPQLIEEPAYDVGGKTILLVEDRVKSGATLNMAKKLLSEWGAAVVKTFARQFHKISHVYWCVFSG